MRAARQRRSRSGGVRGFTLVEILLALLIFVSGVAGVYAWMSTGLALQREGVDRGRQTRRLDEIAEQVARELSAGQHRDAEGAFADVESAELPDGTVYSVAFVPAQGGTLLARIRVASHVRVLERAPEVTYVLPPGPSPAELVRRYRDPAATYGAEGDAVR